MQCFHRNALLSGFGTIFGLTNTLKGIEKAEQIKGWGLFLEKPTVQKGFKLLEQLGVGLTPEAIQQINLKSILTRLNT